MPETAVPVEALDEPSALEELTRLADEGPTADEIERGRVQTESQFMVRNMETHANEPTHLPSFDTFTTGVCELGYFDVFKKSWAELTQPNSLYVDTDDALHIAVKVKLLS